MNLIKHVCKEEEKVVLLLRHVIISAFWLKMAIAWVEVRKVGKVFILSLSFSLPLPLPSLLPSLAFSPFSLSPSFPFPASLYATSHSLPPLLPLSPLSQVIHVSVDSPAWLLFPGAARVGRKHVLIESPLAHERFVFLNVCLYFAIKEEMWSCAQGSS